MIGSVKSNHICTFCKYWYDPTNSNLKMHQPHLGRWEFEANCKKPCLKRKLDTVATATCKEYECKLPY